ncbi:MAG: MarR family transcriptional regulator [Sphingomonadaceae bacterium]
MALATKGVRESFAPSYAVADTALEKLDALLPAQDPLAVLSEWIRQLREDEISFLEGGSEEVMLGGHVFHRFAPRGSAWAASLAAAIRPHLFSLGSAPVALAGLTPRILFQAEPEDPLPALLGHALDQSARQTAQDLAELHGVLQLGEDRLGGLYASSHAPDVWQLISALGPLTRAEIARGLGVTRRTASQVAHALAKAGLAHLRDSDRALETLSL